MSRHTGYKTQSGFVTREKQHQGEARPHRLRVAIEINWIQKNGGARRVASKLAEQLAQHDDIEIRVFTNTQDHQRLDDSIDCQVLNRPRFIPQVIWDQFVFPHWALPRALKRYRPDISLFTNNLMPVRTPGPAVVILHDLTPFVIPETYLRLHGLYQRWYFRHAARHAAHLITVSEHSKQDITQILGVPSTRISVVRLGGDILVEEPATNNELPVEWGITNHPFILYVGAQHPRKNIDRLLQAFVYLKREHAIQHKLVIVGTARWKQTGLVEQAKNGPHGEDIIQAGKVSDDMLVQLYRRCNTFVYPSLYEGFGLPVLEAMSMAAPVVTSQSSSMSEVAGDAAILVNPLDFHDIANGIYKILNDPELASRLRSKGLACAAGYSWEHTGDDVLNVLRSQTRGEK